MRAAVLQAYGPPENLVVREVPDPTITRPTEVRIEVHASSVNPIDAKIRAGDQRGAIRYTLPRVTGMDVSGVVVEVGPGVTRFAVGDEVYGSPSPFAPGCHAEQTVLEADQLGRKPRNLTHVEAATLPLIGLTAWQCLVPWLPEPGRRVLITAGSGGVGTFAIQLAKAKGAWVATTCSGRNAAFVRELGADEVIDYTTTRFQDVLSGIDVGLDALGGDTSDAIAQVLVPGGRISRIVSGMPENTERFGPLLGVLATGAGIASHRVRGLLRGLSAGTVVKKARGDELDGITALVEQGAIRPVVQEVFPLERIADAHRLLETGRVRGKLAIQIAG